MRRFVVGLRREDAGRIWERRSPLSPDSIKALVQRNIEVIVESCQRRVFSDGDLAKAGARIVDAFEPDNPVNLFVGVKETPKNLIDLRSDQAHLFFSHTHKGQTYNRPLLEHFLHPNSPTLVDYELLRHNNARVIAFGWWAGAVGVVEGLVGLGHHALLMGSATQSLHLARPYALGTLNKVKEQLYNLGQAVKNTGTAKAIGTAVIGLTGNGRVSKGAMDMLNEMGVRWISPAELKDVVDANDRHQIYAVQLPPSSYLSHKDKAPFDSQEYFAHPDSFQSHFSTSIAPYLTMFVNGAGWQPGFPRIMTDLDLMKAMNIVKNSSTKRMLVVADIAADIKGGLEFVHKYTTIDEPWYYVKPREDLPATQVMCIDILPTELPLDASLDFSGVLLPYIQAVAKRHRSQDGPEDKVLLETWDSGIIAKNGRLEPEHQHLKASLLRQGSTRNYSIGHRNILVLGSGMVARPAVQTLSKGPYNLVVVGRSTEELAHLKMPNVNLTVLDAQTDAVASFIQEADLVISLLPVNQHVRIAKLCIQHSAHFLSASYVSQEMQSLNTSATKHGIMLFNECGLDPGIDHMSAMSLIDNLPKDAQVTSFTSLCGGLPSKELAKTVPMGYKFSWSPVGVLRAAKSSAKFKLNNRIHNIAASELMTRGVFRDVSVPVLGSFDVIANRDSISYANVYGLEETKLENHFRGTLRHPGYTAAIQVFEAVGLLDDKQHMTFGPENTWQDFMLSVLRQVDPTCAKADMEALVDSMIPGDCREAKDVLKWLGLLPGSTANTNRPALHAGTPIELLSQLLSSMLSYNKDEHDSVFMAHELGYRQNDRMHYVNSTLHLDGDVDSAMARTVGLPIAYAAEEMLTSWQGCTGVQIPTSAMFYKPILSRLGEQGISLREQRGDGSLARNLVQASL